MPAYILRRVLYALPILIGVSLVTFVLFYATSSPEGLARRNLSTKNPTPAQLQQWLKDHGYDKPRSVQFKKHMTELLLFRFGKSDATGEPIWNIIRQGAGPSALVASLVFITALTVAITGALVVAYFRGTYVDYFGTFLCVLLMSIVYVAYVIGFQFLLGRILRYAPLSGYGGAGALRFLLIPVVVGVISGVGATIRLYRTFLLDEMNQDYVRTARAKGVPERTILLRHVLKNASIPILTSVVLAIPGLILGSLLLENFFGIPCLGSRLVDAINSQDFAMVRAMVFLGTVLYIIGSILTDISYAAVDPRVRLE